jgi:uncharacterized protein (TIGR04255 family)
MAQNLLDDGGLGLRIQSKAMNKKVRKNSAYVRPPITEAVIEVVFTNEMTSAAIKSAAKKFIKQYPHNMPVQQYDVRLDLPPNADKLPQANLTGRGEGCRLSNDDQTEILLIWPQSFAVSQVAPYTGWDIFHKRFSRDFKILKKELGHREIARIGVRYINRIDIPSTGPTVEHEEYLNVYPKLPKALTPLLAFAVQAELQMPDVGANLRINTAAVPSPIADHASFLIDLDFFCMHDLPKTDKALTEHLEAIRVKKNEVFESLVTNKARQLFNHAK